MHTGEKQIYLYCVGPELEESPVVKSTYIEPLVCGWYTLALSLFCPFFFHLGSCSQNKILKNKDQANTGEESKNPTEELVSKGNI